MTCNNCTCKLSHEGTIIYVEQPCRNSSNQACTECYCPIPDGYPGTDTQECQDSIDDSVLIDIPNSQGNYEKAIAIHHYHFDKNDGRRIVIRKCYEFVPSTTNLCSATPPGDSGIRIRINGEEHEFLKDGRLTVAIGNRCLTVSKL